MDSYSNAFHLQIPRGNTRGNSLPKLDHFGSKNPRAQRNDFEAESIDDVIKYIHHLSALKELEQIRDQYYKQYISNLETKVRMQRKNLVKQQQFELQNNENKTHSVHKKLPFHQLKHDRKFINDVPKSRYYHILSAENEMKKKGLFKTTRDKEDFWRRVTSDSHVWASPIPTGLPPDVMTNVIVNRYSPNNKFNKQTNDKFNKQAKKKHHISFDISTNKTRSEAELEKFRDQNEILKKLTVKSKFPKLHAYDQLLLPPVTKEPVTLTDTKRKGRFLNSMKSKREAFNLAMVNHAMSRKMMEDHGFCERGGSDLVVRDISDQYRYKEMDIKVPIPAIKSHAHEEIQGKSEVFITEPVFGNDDVLIPDLEYKYTQSPIVHQKTKTKYKRTANTEAARSMHDVGVQVSAEETNTMENKTELKKGSAGDVPSPLSYTMMMENSNLPVKEAKCLSSLWVNYLNIGKT